MKLYARSTIGEITAKHGFRLAKSLGQNFLTDKNIIDKIMEATEIGPEDLVIEIGPGLGVLTAEAAEKGGKVIAIELDSRLIPILKENLADYDSVELIQGDILKTDLHALIEDNLLIKGGPRAGVKILGNLPYYITTPILMKLLEDNIPCDSITIMMQKEVADRLLAPAGTKGCGAISAAVQYRCRVTKVTQVSKNVFIPPPKVDSAVLRLDLLKEKAVKVEDENLFFECIKNGFGQRRKTLGNSLSGTAGYGKEEMEGFLKKAAIDPGRRAETLSLEEFASIANAMGSGALPQSNNQ